MFNKVASLVLPPKAQFFVAEAETRAEKMCSTFLKALQCIENEFYLYSQRRESSEHGAYTTPFPQILTTEL